MGLLASCIALLVMLGCPAGMASANGPPYSDANPNLYSPNDWDVDGLTNAQEAGSNPAQGGGRDPNNHYDYFNPTHDGVNRVDDILAVVNQYFQDDPPGQIDYSSDTDRTPLVGQNPWNLGPPNGQQRVDDILAEVKQYFHDGAPTVWCDGPDGDGVGNVVDPSAPPPAAQTLAQEELGTQYHLLCFKMKDDQGHILGSKIFSGTTTLENLGEVPAGDLSGVEPHPPAGAGGGSCNEWSKAVDCPLHVHALVFRMDGEFDDCQITCIGGDWSHKMKFDVSWDAYYGSVYTGLVRPHQPIASNWYWDADAHPPMTVASESDAHWNWGSGPFDNIGHPEFGYRFVPRFNATFVQTLLIAGFPQVFYEGHCQATIGPWRQTEVWSGGDCWSRQQ